MQQEFPDAATIRNLEDAGCDGDTMRCYCELEKQVGQNPAYRKRQIRLLRKHRQELLDDLHGCQKKIDCLDYLLYRLKEPVHGRGEKR